MERSSLFALSSMVIMFAAGLPGVVSGCKSSVTDSPQPGSVNVSLAVQSGLLTLASGDTLRASIEWVRIMRGEDQQEWAQVADTPRVVDLFFLARGSQFNLADRGVVYLPPGQYTQFRVKVLLPDTLLNLGGSKYPVQMPPEFDPIVRIDAAVSLASDQKVNVLLSLDLDKSLALSGGKYLFTPTFTAR